MTEAELKTELKHAVQNGVSNLIKQNQDDADSSRSAKKEDGKPEVIYASDHPLTELVMVIKGEDGEQHHVYQFNSEGDKSDPSKRKQAHES